MTITTDRFNASTILDRQLDAGRAAKTAIRSTGGDVTYGQLLERACRAGGALRAFGVNRDDRVLLVLDDTPAFPATFLGAIRVGAVPIPVNPLCRVEDVQYFIQDSGCVAVVIDPSAREKTEQAFAAMTGAPPTLLIAGGDETDPASLDAIMAKAPAEIDPADTDARSMAFWLYSSGSTGFPKGVIHRQRDMDATYETYGRQVLGIREDDVTYSSSKYFHAYGMGNSITFPYSVGATTVVTSGRPSPDLVFSTIEQHKPSLFFSVPTLYNALLNSPGATDRDLSSVRLCISAAEALPPEIWQRWMSTFGSTILDGVGSTEMLHIYCSNRVDDQRPGSSGTPVPGYEIQLRGDDGHALEGEAVGDLWVMGPSRLVEYWNKPEKNQQSLDGEWFFSGDRYRRDADGVFWYEGRADDLIKVAGQWVSPIDIENVLIEHRAVIEAAVVGSPVEGLMKIKAFVILTDGAVASDDLILELQELCKTRLQRNKYPHMVEFVHELPKTLTGKIQRFKLRTTAA